MAFSLSSFFNKKDSTSSPDTTIGIDIGSSSVKVIEVERTESALTLKTYGEMQLGPYADQPLGEVVNIDDKKRVEVVTDILREAEATSRNGALAMSLSSSFVTVLSINATPEEDISSRIPVEARKLIPLPLTDVTLDWMEIPPVGEVTTNIREVLLVAIENKALTSYRGLLTTLGMTGEPAEVESFSLVRALWKSTDNTLAIIDLGAKTAKLYIARNGNLERLHRVFGGGSSITRKLSQTLNISFDEAEILKREYQSNDPRATEIFQNMTSVLDGPFAEFRRILEQYEARIGTPVSRVVLSGGVASSPGIIKYAEDKLNHKVEIGNPFAKLAYPAFMEDALKNIAPSFGVALGAALRRMLF